MLAKLASQDQGKGSADAIAEQSERSVPWQPWHFRYSWKSVEIMRNHRHIDILRCSDGKERLWKRCTAKLPILEGISLSMHVHLS